MLTQDQLLHKYADIIKEEVNVKEIWPLQSDKPITKIFKPIGSQLSAKFGKDTGKIIANGKQGNIRELENGEIEVFCPEGNTRTLQATDCEISYEGLEGENIAIEGNMIAKLNLEITPALQREGVARELSRFLNQMRKDADFAVEDKVHLSYQTDSNNLKAIIQEFAQFLKDEALLLSIEEKKENWSITAIFSSGEESLTLSLRK